MDSEMICLGLFEIYSAFVLVFIENLSCVIEIQCDNPNALLRLLV